MNLTQPVSIQSLEDKYDIQVGEQVPRTPTVPGQSLKPTDVKTAILGVDPAKDQIGNQKTNSFDEMVKAGNLIDSQRTIKPHEHG